jgi:hypothetical protein
LREKGKRPDQELSSRLILPTHTLALASFAARTAVVGGDPRQAKRAKPGRFLGIDLPQLILLAARRPSLVLPQLHPDQLRFDFEASVFDARLLRPRHRADSFVEGAM